MSVQFVNPLKKSLFDLKFRAPENGATEIPALDKRWALNDFTLPYKPLCITRGTVDEKAFSIADWIEYTKLYVKQIDNLLCLEHFEFWSTFMHEPAAIDCITSFLQNGVPSYIPITSVTINQDAVNLYSRLLQTVLGVICRMVTNKESDSDWMRRSDLSNLLYSDYLITIPLLFDLVTVYGKLNATVLRKVVKTVFELEPKYIHDLKYAIQCLMKAMSNIIIEVIKSDVTLEKLEQLATYIMDCASTICVFMDLCPDIRSVCIELRLEQTIVEVYDTTIPTLYRAIFALDSQSYELGLLNLARIELIEVFKTLVNFHVDSILTDPSNGLEAAENCIGLLTEALSSKTFVKDYQKIYPVQNDLDIVKQSCPQIESFKLDFIRQSVSVGMSDAITASGEGKEKNGKGASSSRVSKKHLKRMKTIKECLPDLDKRLIRKLAERYEDAEQAITAVLEGNLPPDLVDDAELTEPEEAIAIVTPEELEVQEIMKDRYHDTVLPAADEVVMVRKGKTSTKSLKKQIDDKSHLVELKARYEQYGLVSDNDEYDDEYDDSYDAMGEGEAKMRASAASKNVVVDQIESDSDEEEHYERNLRDNSKDFCENPELARARYERLRQQKYANRTKSKPAKPNDVVGKPKGQGQDNGVLHNRHVKSVHKSSSGNHNRKSGASWKRNKGMIPS